ncbi:MAG: TetR/AcrR family transcriptional regulator C-terminal domain-containing protein [Oscillibacter sp.]|nr:TetR/AcrR family transcriptional regulator C-terminal domain-containing protein [Oscillibacter sp.]
MAQKTKQALVAAFKRLLVKRPLDKITVKDIVEECGVNRQTFYYHFHDIYDMVGWALRDVAEQLLRWDDQNWDWNTAVEALMDVLRQDRLVLNVYHSVGHGVVSDFLEQTMYPYVMRVVRSQGMDMTPPAREEDMELVCEVCTLTCTGILMTWIGKYKMQGHEEWLQRIYIAIHGEAGYMLRNLAHAQKE